MCGLIGGALALPETVLDLIAHRGPDDAGIERVGQFTLGHTRLAIQDVAGAPRQPKGGITFNGEIWDPETLRAGLPGPFTSTGDTEAVLSAVARHSVDALPLLQGMWALAWSDGEHAYLARDPYGEVPLHYGITKGSRVVWASEIGPLLDLGAIPASIRWVPPGHVVMLRPDGVEAISPWDRPHDLTPCDEPVDVKGLLGEGVRNRMRSDVPVAVLISGGLDSSAILALLVQAGYSPQVYTAVHDPKSLDLRHARIVAGVLGLDLNEINVYAPDQQALRVAVRATEMPHKAQIEIAHPCLALAAAMRSDGIKVVLSGEGSDELWASYGMSFHGIKARGWHRYRYETFIGQHRKNFARTNKVFMSHGIEARLPFLHPPLVRAALRMTPAAVRINNHPKGVLAQAFEGILPHASLWRPKAAFQTAARIDIAAAKAVANPRAFYAAEFANAFPGVKP